MIYKMIYKMIWGDMDVVYLCYIAEVAIFVFENCADSELDLNCVFT